LKPLYSDMSSRGPQVGLHTLCSFTQSFFKRPINVEGPVYLPQVWHDRNHTSEVCKNPS